MGNEQGYSTDDLLRILNNEHWPNNACSGYVLIACRNFGYSQKQTNEILSALDDAFGNHSVECAREKYLNNSI